jgi:hypothetical protein
MGRSVMFTEPQDSEVYLHPVRVEYEAAKMARIDQRL